MKNELDYRGEEKRREEKRREKRREEKRREEKCVEIVEERGGRGGQGQGHGRPGEVAWGWAKGEMRNEKYVSDVVDRVYLGRKAAVNAEELLVHEGGEGQRVEGCHARIVHPLAVFDLAYTHTAHCTLHTTHYTLLIFFFTLLRFPSYAFY